MTSLYAAAYAPWVRNIRPLIDPMNVGRPESTWSFLFALPVVLTVAWLITVYGRDLLRDMRVLKNQIVEFAIAGVIAFALFYMSIDRAVAALLLGAAVRRLDPASALRSRSSRRAPRPARNSASAADVVSERLGRR